MRKREIVLPTSLVEDQEADVLFQIGGRKRGGRVQDGEQVGEGWEVGRPVFAEDSGVDAEDVGAAGERIFAA